MIRFVLAGIVVGAVAPIAAHAQTVTFRLEAIGLTYQEIDQGGEIEGEGGGGAVELRFRRFRLEATGYSVRFDRGDAPRMDLAQVDVRLSYRVSPFLALEVGGGRRYVDPEFATQEVGLIRIGVLSENALNRLADVWVRGAYLAQPKFSGGGSADLAFEFGLGVGVGTANRRFRFRAEYEFQRIDREVAPNDVPIQTSLARLGIAVGF